MQSFPNSFQRYETSFEHLTYFISNSWVAALSHSILPYPFYHGPSSALTLSLSPRFGLIPSNTLL